MKPWMYYIPIVGFILAFTHNDDMPFDRFSLMILAPWQGITTGGPLVILIYYLIYGHL